ncbi:MAG: hypothetical protein IPP37_17455, partial [Saprospiraceae bacterium]|nr:hypothetical protein [Saprospiraceae bacterium]
MIPPCSMSIIHPKPLADFALLIKNIVWATIRSKYKTILRGRGLYAMAVSKQQRHIGATTLWPAAFGNFDIELMATSDRSCKDTMVKTITVLPSAMADFTTNKVNGCEDLQVDFNN